jgi:hypothetical protein
MRCPEGSRRLEPGIAQEVTFEDWLQCDAERSGADAAAEVYGGNHWATI